MGLQIIKFGGGLIAEKSKQKGANLSVIRSLSEQIARSRKNVVIVHGAGSFGHNLAKEYRLHLGFKDISQYRGIIETRNSMQELNSIVVSVLNDKGLKAVPIITSSIALNEDGRIKSFDTRKVNNALKKGHVPVLCSDVVFDSSMGFSILSGDQIVCYLNKALNAEKSIFTLDVDGVYTGDPKKNKDAKIEEKIKFNDIDSFLIKAKTVGDTTGGMLGKLVEIKNAGSGVFVLGNGKNKDWLYKAIMGQNIIGTVIS